MAAVKLLKPLNSGGGTDQISEEPATDISRELQKVMLRIRSEFIHDGGSAVDYATLRSSSLFKDYIILARQLRTVDLKTLTDVQRMVFIINVYNALNIHGLLAMHSLPKSVLDAHSYWQTTAYQIGEHVYSLDDLEHGLLRANSPPPTSVERQFKFGDPRLEFALPQLEPRIHFALNCGAKSCPPIQIYSENNVEAALDASTRNFCKSEISANLDKRVISLSRMFHWYRKDFGRNETEVLRWTMNHLEPEKQFAVDRLLHELEDIGGVTISYTDYDWSLNRIVPNVQYLTNDP